MADIGQAYVQIIPKAEGISKNVTSLLAPGMDKAGKAAGSKFGSMFGGAMSVGIGNLLSQGVNKAISGVTGLVDKVKGVGEAALSSYGQFEQLSGGVTKLFGEDAAKIVAENAQNAFQTAQMSANEYMENVTGFSATLVAGLGGDTAEAARVADIAVRDMADNANIFGSDMESITRAYQGFAKDNYTMLDNLKLGFGGSAGEMARLINESGVLGDSIEVTAETVKDVPFDKVIEAIHKTQEEMNITGTTAKEAAGTMQGATGSMSAAWQNLLTGMVDETADMGELTKNFIGTLITPDGKGGYLGTMIPRVAKVISGMATALKTTLPQLVNAILPVLKDNLPIIIDSIGQALEAIAQTIPLLFPVIIDALNQVILSLISFAPDLVMIGLQLISALLEGIASALPQINAMLPGIIQEITEVLVEFLPDIIYYGGQIILALIDGIIQMLPQLATSIPAIVGVIVEMLLKGLPALIQAGIELFTALVKALPIIIQEITDDIPQIVDSIVNAFVAAAPAITAAGVELFLALIENLPVIIKGINDAAEQLIMSFIEALSNNHADIAKAGVNAGNRLLEGISNIAKQIPVAIKNRWEEIKRQTRQSFQIISIIAGNIWEIIKKKITGKVDEIKESIRGKWESIKASASNAFQTVKNLIVNPIEQARSAIGRALQRIRGLFPLSIGRVFSNLQLPHFEVTAGVAPYGLGGKGTKPGFNVRWYAQGGIFDAPSLVGVGEAGREAIIPLSGANMRPFAEAIADEMGNGGTTYNIGDVTLEVGDLKDVVTLEQFVEMLRQIKGYA